MLGIKKSKLGLRLFLLLLQNIIVIPFPGVSSVRAQDRIEVKCEGLFQKSPHPRSLQKISLFQFRAKGDAHTDAVLRQLAQLYVDIKVYQEKGDRFFTDSLYPIFKNSFNQAKAAGIDLSDFNQYVQEAWENKRNNITNEKNRSDESISSESKKITNLVGKFRFEPKPNGAQLKSTELSPNEKMVAHIDHLRPVTIWSTETGKLMHTFETQIPSHEGYEAGKFTLDSKKIVLISTFNIEIRDVVTGALEHITKRPTSEDVRALEMSPDGKHFMISCATDHMIRVWELQTNQEVFTFANGQKFQSESIRFSPDNKLIMTSDSISRITKIWDTTTGQEVSNKGTILRASLSADGKYLAAADLNSVNIWDLTKDKEIYVLKGHIFPPDAYAIAEAMNFSIDSKLLVTASPDQTAKAWDLATGKEIFTMKGHTATLISARFSPDGNYIATGARDGTARIWSAKTGALIHALKPKFSDVESVDFSPNSKYLVLTSDRNRHSVWYVETGKEVDFSLEGEGAEFNQVIFNHDASEVITGSFDNVVRVWEESSLFEGVKPPGPAPR